MEFTFLEFLKYDYPSILLVVGLIVLMLANRKKQAARGVYAVDHDDHHGAVAVCGVRLQMVGERSVACGYPVLDDDHQIPHPPDNPDDADHGVGGEQGDSLAVGDPESDQRACRDDRAVCDRTHRTVL